jgi:hypothetical protein
MNRDSWDILNFSSAILLFTILFIFSKKSQKNNLKSSESNSINSNNFSNENNASTKSSVCHPPKKEVFHYVLYYGERENDLDKIQIKASAYSIANSDGTIKYGLDIFGANPLETLEGIFAIKWKTMLDCGEISINKAHNFINMLCNSVFINYWGKAHRDIDQKTEPIMLYALAKASLHYSIANSHSIGFPDSNVEYIAKLKTLLKKPH